MKEKCTELKPRENQILYLKLRNISQKDFDWIEKMAEERKLGWIVDDENLDPTPQVWEIV